MGKYYLYDGGDSITAGDGKNLFYFYGSFTNGATTIDKLNIDDQLRFRNDCKKWKTVYAQRDLVPLVGDDLTGPWSVSLTDLTVTICHKPGSTDEVCKDIQTPKTKTCPKN